MIVLLRMWKSLGMLFSVGLSQVASTGSHNRWQLIYSWGIASSDERVWYGLPFLALLNQYLQSLTIINVEFSIIVIHWDGQWSLSSMTVDYLSLPSWSSLKFHITTSLQPPVLPLEMAQPSVPCWAWNCDVTRTALGAPWNQRFKAGQLIDARLFQHVLAGLRYLYQSHEWLSSTSK